MKKLKEYQKEFKLFDFELPYFKKFLEDPNQKEYYPVKRVIVKCEDGSLCLHKGRFESKTLKY